MFASFPTNLTRVGSNVEILVGSVIEFMVSGGNTSNAGGISETSVALNVTVNPSLVEVETEVSGGVADILTDDAPVFVVDAVISVPIDARMIDTELRTCVEVTISDNTSLVEADKGARFTSDPSSVEIEVGTSVVNNDS